MMCISGPPWMPGNTRLLIVFPYSSLARHRPARGPRSVLCVVVVTKSATGTGLLCKPAATRPGVVSHVDHQLRADLASNFGELFVRDLARIGAGASHDHFRFVLAGKRGDLIEIEAVRIARYAVADEVIQHAADVELHAVREVAAVGQVEAEHRVARFERRKVNRRVGLRTAVGLDVGELGAKQLLRAIDRQLLDDVDEFAAAVISSTGIALGILVREHAAGRLHYGRARVVLAGDHFQAVGLAFDLALRSPSTRPDRFSR